MDTNLRVILQQLEAEKSIDRNTLLEAIRSAIESAARKSMSHASNVLVEVDPENLAFKVFEIRTVVDEITDTTGEITLEDAQELNPGAEVGNMLKLAAEPRNFGRIAAQTAKQVIIQKIKDAERDNIYDEFKGREGELVTGFVRRMSHGNLIVTVDRAEAIVPPREQSQRENFKPGDRVRAFLVQVEKTPRGAQVILSRSTPLLVQALFEHEVPEIYDGTIEIRAIAREAGSRTKVAVLSNDPNVDAVGACVGMKGSRVRAVVEELSGEKIDIVRWSEDASEICRNALNPADIMDLTLDEENKTVLVVVPHDQLSLAIGKKGQNARLASKLIGWNIDIRSDLEMSGQAPPREGEAPPAAAAPSEAAATEPEATESAATEPEATAPAATESVPEAENTEPVSAETEATEAESTEPVSAETEAENAEASEAEASEAEAESPQEEATPAATEDNEEKPAEAVQAEEK